MLYTRTSQVVRSTPGTRRSVTRSPWPITVMVTDSELLSGTVRVTDGRRRAAHRPSLQRSVTVESDSARPVTRAG